MTKEYKRFRAARTLLLFSIAVTCIIYSVLHGVIWYEDITAKCTETSTTRGEICEGDTIYAVQKIHGVYQWYTRGNEVAVESDVPAGQHVKVERPTSYVAFYRYEDGVKYIRVTWGRNSVSWINVSDISEDTFTSYVP